MPATGTVGTTDSVAARITKPDPVTPAAPLELIMATSTSVSCSHSVNSTPTACAMNNAASVM